MQWSSGHDLVKLQEWRAFMKANAQGVWSVPDIEAGDEAGGCRVREICPEDITPTILWHSQFAKQLLVGVDPFHL